MLTACDQSQNASTPTQRDKHVNITPKKPPLLNRIIYSVMLYCGKEDFHYFQVGCNLSYSKPKIQ